eukprot:168268-Amphidinium_carterae.3
MPNAVVIVVDEGDLRVAEVDDDELVHVVDTIVKVVELLPSNRSRASLREPLPARSSSATCR